MHENIIANAKMTFNLYKRGKKKKEKLRIYKVQTFGNNARESKREDTGELPTLTRGFCKSYRGIK